MAIVRVKVHEAKIHFFRLLRRVAAGEEIEIVRGDMLVARLVPARLVPARAEVPRSFGSARGQFVVPDDFDSPLSEEELESFE